jgi:hypothetical protein
VCSNGDAANNDARVEWNTRSAGGRGQPVRRISHTAWEEWGMSAERKVDRRTFVGVVAGAAGAAAVEPFSPSLAVGHDRGRGRGGRLIPRHRIGLQQWSIRDAITRLGIELINYAVV